MRPAHPPQADLVDVLFRLARSGHDDLHTVALSSPGLPGRKGGGEGGGLAVARFESMMKKPTKVSWLRESGGLGPALGSLSSPRLIEPN